MAALPVERGTDVIDEIDGDLTMHGLNLIDRTGMPALAVEYQGHGHHQNRAFMRDAVKREAVRKAGVRLLEIPTEFDAKVLKDRIREALRSSKRLRFSTDPRRQQLRIT